MSVQKHLLVFKAKLKYVKSQQFKNIKTIWKMIALFAILLQFAFAKNDLIAENKDGTFIRYEDGECVYTGKGQSMKVTFTSTEAVAKHYGNDDCSGDVKKEEKTEIAKSGMKVMECPKYLGFIAKDGTSDCKYQKYAYRTYYKEGCFPKNDKEYYKYAIENNKLTRKTFDNKDCSGTAKEDVADQNFAGECNKCHTIADDKTSELVICGTVSQMILAVLAVLFFLF